MIISVPVQLIFAQSDDIEQEVVTITEYGDYQCPTCAYYHPITEKIKINFGSDVSVEYRYFPLRSHQHAYLAARAAQSAKNQGKFKQMHDLLFENQSNWANSANPTSIFLGYARKIDLDIEKFREDLNASETQGIIVEQKQEGVRKGVDGTPTFFINGEKVPQLPRNYQAFEKLVYDYISEGDN